MSANSAVSQAAKGSKSELVVAISVVVGVGVALYGLIGFSSRCSKCNGWFCIEDKDRKLTSQRSKTRDGDRQEPYLGASEQKPGVIRRRERIFLIERTYEVTKACSKCGHNWTETQLETV